MANQVDFRPPESQETMAAPASTQFSMVPGVFCSHSHLASTSPVHTVAPRRPMPGEKARFNEKNL